jgi:hypothetical protein
MARSAFCRDGAWRVGSAPRIGPRACTHTPRRRGIAAGPINTHRESRS